MEIGLLNLYYEGEEFVSGWVTKERGNKMSKKPALRPKDERVRDFNELLPRISAQWAIAEARRCLLCEDAPCEKGCPAGVPIVKFIRQIRNENFKSAIKFIREANIFAGVCGRVCPQSILCEGKCTSTGLSEPIAIGLLQRFVADIDKNPQIPELPPITKSKIAIAGAGPSGLACAWELRKMGYDVHIFESKSMPGGLLRYGIPQYRLPEFIVNAEISIIERAGVTFHLGCEIKNLTELLIEYKAIYIAIGAKEKKLNLPGENLKGVYSALQLLADVNEALRNAKPLPQIHPPVVVIGGGNTAMDAASCSIRLAGGPVSIFYRRTEEDLPAWKEEVAFAREEGVEFRFLRNPIEFVGENGVLHKVKFQIMECAGKDKDGRNRVVPVSEEYEIVEARTAILAVGQLDENPSSIFPGLEITNKDELATNIRGVFAGGDFVSGGKTVVQAIADGKKAAKKIAEFVQ